MRYQLYVLYKRITLNPKAYIYWKLEYFCLFCFVSRQGLTMQSCLEFSLYSHGHHFCYSPFLCRTQSYPKLFSFCLKDFCKRIFLWCKIYKPTGDGFLKSIWKLLIEPYYLRETIMGNEFCVESVVSLNTVWLFLFCVIFYLVLAITHKIVPLPSSLFLCTHLLSLRSLLTSFSLFLGFSSLI